MSAPLPPYPDLLQYYYRGDYDTYSDQAGATPATNGQTVLRWKDQGGLGNDLQIASAGLVLETNQINSLACLRGDGSTTNFQLSNLFLSPNRTVFNVSKISNGGVNTVLCGGTASLQYRLDGLKQRLVNAGVADIGFATNAMSSGTWTQQNVSWDGQNGVFRQGSAANGSVGPTSYESVSNIMSRVGVHSGGEFYGGDLALLMEYAGVLTTAQRQAVEAWILGIWGV